MADVHVQPTRKRRRTETTQISTETYDVTDYRPTQDELMVVDDFMVLNDIIIDPTDDRNYRENRRRTNYNLRQDKTDVGQKL